MAPHSLSRKGDLKMTLLPQFLSHQIGVITNTTMGIGSRECTSYYGSQAIWVTRTDSERYSRYRNMIWSFLSLVNCLVLLTRFIPFTVQALIQSSKASLHGAQPDFCHCTGVQNA